MAGFIPAIHVFFLATPQGVDARVKPGHDETRFRARFNCQTAAVVRRHDIAISPRISREFCRNVASPKIQRAQGMPGARCARSLACDKK
jgi:hypothetical protein